MLPAAVLTFVACPSALAALTDAADYVRFAALADRYVGSVASMPADGHRLRWFLWRDTSTFAAGETLVFLVFDESDEIAAAVRSDAWTLRARETFMDETGWSADGAAPRPRHRLFGHWYVVFVNE